MLYDHRTYTCHPGTIRKQLALYGEHGFPVQLRHIGRPLLHSVTEIGDVNSYVHIWVYEDMADRERKRAAMKADPDIDSWEPAISPMRSRISGSVMAMNAARLADHGQGEIG